MEVGFQGERIIVVPHPFMELMRDNPLTGDLYICSLGYIPHARHHVIDRPKGSESYIFLYCVWGKGSLSIGRRTIGLKANQFIVLPKDIPLSCRAADDDPWSIYWVCFDGEKGKIFAKAISEPADALPSIHTRIEQRIELFERIYSVMCGEITLDRLDYANMVFSHFLATFRFGRLDSIKDESPRHSEGMVNRVIQFMNDNIERKLTIKELSACAGYSESYFYRQFVRQTSMSPIDYFIHLKINKAAILLLKTTMSISQIAAKLGFGSTEYFSRTFRKALGISASDFRKQDFRL